MSETSFYRLFGLPLQPDWYCSLHTSLKYDFTEAQLWSIATGETRLSEPLKVQIKGRRRVDLVGGLDTFLANERVLVLLRDNAFTGWGTFPVHVAGLKTVKERFAGLVIKGRAGPFIGKEVMDVRFDPATWDGSDFFLLKNTALKIVTRRVVDALQDAGITGAHYQPVNVH